MIFVKRLVYDFMT